MKWLSLFFWFLFGVGLAWIYLKTQLWSVKMIKPDRRRFSKLIIVGGAVVRWAVVFLCLLLALSFSLPAVFLVFGSFMVTRLLILLHRERIIFPKLKQKN